MTEFLTNYGLFLMKTATVVAGFLIVIGMSIVLSKKSKTLEKLEVVCLNEKYEAMASALQDHILAKKEKKRLAKARKAEKKERKKHPEDANEKRIFVVNFHGDIRATNVASLREEITAILTLANKTDEVLVKLENTGGIVHEHGLGASQLLRLRDSGIPITVAVDKVAASGGYMMACVAQKIIAAPFAVIGSIGVLAQLPNFHELLTRQGIRFEQETAGEYKRSVTMFGENTEKDREKTARANRGNSHSVQGFCRPAPAKPRYGTNCDRGTLVWNSRPGTGADRRDIDQRRLLTRSQQKNALV